jgi:hypothetical protein
MARRAGFLLQLAREGLPIGMREPYNRDVGWCVEDAGCRTG